MALFIDINIGSRVPIRPEHALDEFPVYGMPPEWYLDDGVAGWVDGYLKGFPKITKDELLEHVEYWLLCAEVADEREPVDRGDGGGGDG